MGETNTLKNATISSGQTTSNAVAIEANETLAVVYTPATVAGTVLTLQGSHDGTNFFDIRDARLNAAVTIPVTVSASFSIPPVVTYGYNFVRLSTNSAAGVGGESYGLVMRNVQ